MQSVLDQNVVMRYMTADSCPWNFESRNMEQIRQMATRGECWKHAQLEEHRAAVSKPKPPMRGSYVAERRHHYVEPGADAGRKCSSSVQVWFLQQEVPDKNYTVLLICLEKIELKPMNFAAMNKKVILRNSTHSINIPTSHPGGARVEAEAHIAKV